MMLRETERIGKERSDIKPSAVHFSLPETKCLNHRHGLFQHHVPLQPEQEEDLYGAAAGSVDVVVVVARAAAPGGGTGGLVGTVLAQSK